jgi:BRCT domain type II-containing protein
MQAPPRLPSLVDDVSADRTFTDLEAIPIVEGAEPAASKDMSSPGETASDAVDSREPAAFPEATPAPAHGRAPVHTGVVPHPARSTTASPVGAGNTGTLRVSTALGGILIDGTPHKVNGGSVVVACGRHMVKAPGQSARVVMVPCGGRATF